MKTLLLATLALLFTVSSGAQTFFEKRYTLTTGGDEARSICETPGGGYAIAGVMKTAATAFILRLNAAGNPLWTRTYNCGTGLEDFMDIETAGTNGFVTCGNSFSFSSGTSNILVVRVDSLGNVMWSKIIGDPFSQLNASSVKVAPNGNIYVFGYYPGGYGPMNHLSCFDASGSLLWSHAYGFGLQGMRGEMVACADNGCFFTQDVLDTLSHRGVLACKTDSTGNIEWSYLFSDTVGNLLNTGRSTRQTIDYGFIIAGFSSDSSGMQHLLLLQLDTSGNLTWSKRYGWGLDVQEPMLDFTIDKKFIVAFRLNNATDGLLLKVDEYGNIAWSKKYGQQNELFEKVCALPNGYAVTGKSYLTPAQTYVYLARTDTGGVTGCEQLQPCTATNRVLQRLPHTFTWPGEPDSAVACTTTMIVAGIQVLCTTGLDMQNSGEDLSLFPNPSSGEFLLTLPDAKERTITVVNALGEIVVAQQVNGTQLRLDLSRNAKGVYFMRVHDEETGESVVEKIVLQ